MKEVCAPCPHSKKIVNHYLDKLLHFYRIQSAGCPVGRHELADEEWTDLGAVKDEWQKLETEWWEKNRPKIPGPGQ